MKSEVEAIAVFKEDLEDEQKRVLKEADQKVFKLKLENEAMRMTIKKMADESSRTNNANAKILTQMSVRARTDTQETQTDLPQNDVEVVDISEDMLERRLNAMNKESR